MPNGGYIKIWRSLLDWEWYDDANTLRVFLHLLLTANHEDGEWHGMIIRRGQVVTSYAKLSHSLGLSVDMVRTTLDHLKSTGEVTHSAGPNFGVFTVKNYDKYQSVPPFTPQESQSTAHPFAQSNPSPQPTRIPTNKNKEKEEINNPPISPQGNPGESLEVQTASGTAAADTHSKTPEPEGFVEFWSAYPLKKSKGDARRAWQKIKPGKALREKMLAAIERAKQSEQWRREGGRYIPYPATWLNQERWEDEDLAAPDPAPVPSPGIVIPEGVPPEEIDWAAVYGDKPLDDLPEDVSLQDLLERSFGTNGERS